jgi:hypothetical protein
MVSIVQLRARYQEIVHITLLFYYYEIIPESFCDEIVKRHLFQNLDQI